MTGSHLSQNPDQFSRQLGSVWLAHLPSELLAATGGDRGGMWSYEEPLVICIKEEFSLPITARVHCAYSIQATSLAFPPLGLHSGLALWKRSKEKETFSLHQDEESMEASSIPVSPGQEASSMVKFAVIHGQMPLPSSLSVPIEMEVTTFPIPDTA